MEFNKRIEKNLWMNLISSADAEKIDFYREIDNAIVPSTVYCIILPENTSTAIAKVIVK